MANSECRPWDLVCKGGEGIKNLADSAIAEFIESMFDGAVAFMSQISTFWMDSPSPDVNNAAVISLREDMSWYVAGFAILGFFLGLIKLVISQDVKNSLIGLATPIVNLILAATAYAVGIGVLLTASDEFSKWIVQRSTGGEVDLTQMLPSVSVLIASPGTAFLLYILLLLGSIINLLFMYFRDVMFLILSAFIVVLAAASGSEQGRQAWRKANGWLVALLLFKPVAAGIYSLGLRVLAPTGTTEGQEPSVPEAMHATLIALLILLLAALALPALIKFIVPAAGVGAGAFSGGAALGAGVTLAAGAAVLAGTGGAAAAGKGAAAMPQGFSNAASTSVAGEGANSSAPTGSPSTGGDSGSGAGDGSSGGSGASKAISDGGTDGGAAASAPSLDGSGSGTGPSSGGSSTGTSSESAGSGSSTSPDSSSSPSGASSKSGNGTQASNTGQGSANSEGVPSAGGPTGAKAPSRLNEAMQKMGEVKGLANGANPSKLVDEDSE